MVVKILSKSLTIILALVLVLMIVAVISSKASGGNPSFFGYQLKSVLSGSMEPGIHTGSIVSIKPGGDMTRFKKGDVITFKAQENILITHRIVEVIKNNQQVMYRTKGDNNDAPDMDPVLSTNVIGEYTGFTVPYAGYMMKFANSKLGSLLLLVLPGLLLLLYSGITTWKAISGIDKPQVDSPTIKS